MLKRELEQIFTLNEMQKKAYENRGKNLVFNAPTGSGKTEAVLLSIPEGKSVSFLLPTITSSIFMYRRLKESGLFNLDLKTSILKETDSVRNPILNIEIHTPDGPLIEYMQNGSQSLNDVVVMDELDNYPPMVKTVLIDYIKNNPKTQFLVASATLDSNLKKAFKDFEKIEYNTEIDLLKFRTENFFADEYPTEEEYEELQNILNLVPENGKIGFIFNCIDNMENFADSYRKIFYDENGELKEGIIMHHSNVDVDTRNKNEEKLFNGDYKICISNDIISYSVDINFDTMFMETSDRTATNIQRMGRCNRYNNEIGDKTNLYIMPNLYTPPFMDSWDKREETEKFSEQEFYYTDIEEMREELPLEPIPTFEKVKDFIEKRKKMGLEPSLREIPITFEITKETKEYNKKTKKEENVIKKFHIKPIGDDIPYADYPVRPVIDENGKITELKKDIVYISKRRVCDDYFIMLNNKVPVKTERLDYEDYKSLAMSEEVLDYYLEDLNQLKTFTDGLTEIFSKIDKTLDKIYSDIPDLQNKDYTETFKSKILEFIRCEEIFDEFIFDEFKDYYIKDASKHILRNLFDHINYGKNFDKMFNFTSMFENDRHVSHNLLQRTKKFVKKFEDRINTHDFQENLDNILEKALKEEYGFSLEKDSKKEKSQNMIR